VTNSPVSTPRAQASLVEHVGGLVVDFPAGDAPRGVAGSPAAGVVGDSTTCEWCGGSVSPLAPTEERCPDPWDHDRRNAGNETTWRWWAT
jgi:hypothetical protein